MLRSSPSTQRQTCSRSRNRTKKLSPTIPAVSQASAFIGDRTGVLRCDRIQFTAPDKSLGVAIATSLPSSRSIPMAAYPSTSTTTARSNLTLRASSSRPRVCVTSHSSQGLTAERVLVHADTRVHPDLLNSRFAYVSISRASHEATLFTDDMAKLGPQLGAMSRRPPPWKSIKSHPSPRELG